VAWVALAPLLIALAGTSGWRAARLGYVTGAVSSIGLLYWTALVVIQYGGLALPVGILVMVALCLAFSVFHALFGWGAARLVVAFGPAGLLGAPFLWTGLEYARTHTLFSFPWTLLGYSQHTALPFAQVASIAAVYGVSFLVCSVSALLAYAGLEPGTGKRRAALASVTVLVVAAWGWGRWQMDQPVAQTGRVKIGLVQGGVRQEDKWVPESAWDNVDRHVELTEEAARRGARLVVWPESAVPFLFDEDPGLASLLQDAVRLRGIYIFFGNDDRESFGGRGFTLGRSSRSFGELSPATTRSSSSLRRVRAAPAALHLGRALRGQARAGGLGLHPRNGGRDRRRGRPPGRRLHLLRGDLPVPRPSLRCRGGGAAGQRHE
jgi:apolipoprotein N-acyltransferase